MKVNINLASGQNFADLTIIDNDLSVQKKKIPVKSLWDVFYSKKCQTYFHPCTFFNSYESKAKQPGLLYGVSKTDSSEGLYFCPLLKDT